MRNFKKKPLGISKELFNGFEDAGIMYCHWKSNEHLLEGLLGETDLDILAEQIDREKVQRVMIENNCKKVVSQPWQRFPDIEDWLGFDEQRGGLIHIHLHYKLLMGKRHTKELHFPYERIVLARRVKDDNLGVYLCKPEIELVILIFRIALKTSLFQISLGLFKPGFLPENLISEFSYLKKMVNRNVVKKYLHEFYKNNEVPEVLNAIICDCKFSVINLLKLKVSVRNQFKNQIRYNFLKRQKIYFLKKAEFFISRNKNKYFSPTRTKKIFHENGTVIAVIGCDGSGKTSVVNALTSWLSWKIDVENVYLGSGDGDIGIILRWKKKLERFIKQMKIKTASDKKHQPNAMISSKNGLRASVNHFFQCAFNMALARERYRKVMRIQKAKAVGKVVITDRFPQNQFEGIYDGPKIDLRPNSGFFCQLLSKIERKIYDRIAKFPPDLVIKLHVPIEVSMKRKPEENYKTVQKKILITKQLQYSETEIVDIDSSEPFIEVINKIKAVIWNFL